MKIVENEMRYQLLLSLIGNLEEKGLISNEEYEEIKDTLIEKYSPFISELFCCNNLTN